MRLTRRQLLAGAAGSAIGAAGIYELVDQLTSSPERHLSVRHPAKLEAEQHLLDLRVITDNGVEVVVPPLHHEITTARIRTGTDLAEAKDELERRLRELDDRFDPTTPAGLGITVAWGLPYLKRAVPRPWRTHLPVDLRESAAGRPVAAVTEAIRFPSDMDDTILEQNDLAVLLRSDHASHVRAGQRAIFDGFDALEPRSIRRGFQGGGFDGEQSLPKRIALAAGIPGADLIPDTAQLFLGFTSTQRAAMGPTRIANFETLGNIDLRGGYFRGGTHMHLSHIVEDVEAWYLAFDFRDRVDTTFRPDLKVSPGTQTVRQDPRDVATEAAVERDFHRAGTIGHSASIQPTSRLGSDHVGPDGTVFPKGTAVPQRADFNTIDNPFAWTADPARDAWSELPAAGLHFVVFNPSSGDFTRNRLAMDGRYPNGVRLPFERGARGQGLNSILHATHRQNFLVPPRRHRSFPLAELL
jgi:hypothetical protein